MKRKIFLSYAIVLICLLSLTASDGQPIDDALPAGAIAQFNHRADVYTVAFSPDGQHLAVGGDNSTVILWDVANEDKSEVFGGHSKSVMSVAFSPDGHLLASASLDGFVRVWDVVSGNRLRGPEHKHDGNVKSVAFSPDGEVVASGGGDQKGSVMFRDISRNNRIAPRTGHNDIVESIAFSPDGSLFASTDRDGAIKLWDVTGQQIRKPSMKHKGVVYAAVFSPDGEVLATTSRDKSIKLWQVSSGENLVSLPVDRINSTYRVYATALAFSPDGKYLAAGCGDDTIKLWNAVNHRVFKTLTGHTAEVTSVAFSPDGRTLASGSRDRTVLLWDLSHFNVVPPEINALPKPTAIADTTPPNTVADTIPPNIEIISPTGRIVPDTTEYLTIRGQVTDNNGIAEVKVNGLEVEVLAEGRFSTSVELNGGENEIRITATDIHGNMDTNRFIVVRPVPLDLNPPTISLNLQRQNQVAAEHEYFSFQGSVTDDNSVSIVKVNNDAVYLSEGGVFTATVPLSYGENEIRIAATDIHGNMDTNRFTVSRAFPRRVPNPGPVIRILQPPGVSAKRGIKPIITIYDATTAVTGEVEDDDGVSEIRVDNITAQLRGKEFSTSVSLTYGENSVRVVATDKLGNQSYKEIVIYRPRNIREGKDYALLFAVEDYDDWPKLRKPVSDAETVQQDLEDLYGFQTRLIKNPTKADIFEAFREYAKKDYPDDAQLFIFFAGHGHFDDAFKGGYLVARDTKLPSDKDAIISYVSHSEIHDIVNRMNCKHIFLVLDTCYSGTFDQEIAMRGSPESLSERDITRKFKYTTRWYLTSGGKERVPDESAFVRALLEALRSKGGGDDILTIAEILSEMEDVKPTPRASGFGSDEAGSDFLFFAID